MLLNRGSLTYIAGLTLAVIFLFTATRKYGREIAVRLHRDGQTVLEDISPGWQEDGESAKHGETPPLEFENFPLSGGEGKANDVLDGEKGEVLTGDVGQISGEPEIDPTIDLSKFNPADTHIILKSVSSPDGKYWRVKMGPNEPEVINPNFIPHPTNPANDTWIIVAQTIGKPEHSIYWSTEVSCEASFRDDTLQCLDSSPSHNVPIAASYSDGCHGSLTVLKINVGPHDARFFYGPDAPYIMYGSQSGFGCFGQWMQDYRMLQDWPVEDWFWNHTRAWWTPTELQRPPPVGPVEKNWFIFWAGNESYVHHDISPHRAFAKLEGDGSVGADLAVVTKAEDDKCMNKYMVKLGPGKESIHQATNSLLITMCNRADPACIPSDNNTFIFHIYHYKTFFQWHSVYEPYVMMFDSQAPFAVHAMSQKPLWIEGRGGPGSGRQKVNGTTIIPDIKGWNHTEMFYVTSINWKQKGLNYHGFMDDTIMLGFGIEDSKGGGIDVKAGDLVGELGLCSEV